MFDVVSVVFSRHGILIAPVNGKVTRENWYQTQAGMEKVQGDLARLGTQFTAEYMLEMDILCKRVNWKRT